MSTNGDDFAAKLTNVEPFGYFVSVLQCMEDGYPTNQPDELLPWNLKVENPDKR